MKKYFLIMMLFIFAFGCSKNSTENGEDYKLNKTSFKLEKYESCVIGNFDGSDLVITYLGWDEEKNIVLATASEIIRTSADSGLPIQIYSSNKRYVIRINYCSNAQRIEFYIIDILKLY